MNLPQHLMFPISEFGDSFQEKVLVGSRLLSSSRLAIVGLARNCAGPLLENLRRLLGLVENAAGWQLHIETNDNTDDTVQVLTDFCSEHRSATFASHTLGRQQFSAEFAGPRTIALAEYRAACQQWVRECAADADFVIVIDWDQWGGWSSAGLLNGLGWLAKKPDAYGMASVSLFEHDFGDGRRFVHYDLWALRGVGQADCFWDTYLNGYGGFGYTWLPAVGSPPVLVASAFGGLAVYRTAAYLQGTYDGTADCEHVAFHRSIAAATGQRLYLNPSQRSVMHWMNDGGQHGDD
jgi:hypothetical protein